MMLASEMMITIPKRKALQAHLRIMKKKKTFEEIAYPLKHIGITKLKKIKEEITQHKKVILELINIDLISHL